MTVNTGMRLLAATLATMSALSSPASAGVIVAPTGATVVQGGSQTSIANTFNQSGLDRNYVSGVTDYDSFFKPRVYSMPASTNEWFAATAGTAIVVYDLGLLSTIASLSFWNEDAYGVNRFELLHSRDNQTFTSLGSFAPTDAPSSGIAFNDRFDFTAIDARYFKLVLNDCPSTAMAVCSISEVAFNRIAIPAAVTAAVPEPGNWAMMMLGFGGVGFALRRRAKADTRVRLA